MTPAEAYDLLLAHSIMHPDDNHPVHSTGFLAMLRPYRKLAEDNFHEVLQALRLLAPELRNGATLDRQVIIALWAICHYARAWALDADGMLRRNQLITADDQERLATWLNIISDTVSNLLEGANDTVAFEAYHFYVADMEDPHVDNS